MIESATICCLTAITEYSISLISADELAKLDPSTWDSNLLILKLMADQNSFVYVSVQVMTNWQFAPLAEVR